MKHKSKCTKCNGTDLVKIKGTTGQTGTGSVIAMGVTPAHGYVPVTRIVCLTCGYTEEWIDAEKDLDRLRRRFHTK